MGIMKWLKTGAVVGAMTLAPTISMQAAVQACNPIGPPSSESYTSNFPGEGSHLLADVQQDARRAAYHASQLESYTNNPEITWELHADQLQRIRHDVNDMGKRLCRLETIRRDLSPWEQQALSQVAPQLQYMADNTTDAIHYVNQYENNFWVPSYKSYTQNLYHEANTVSRTIHNDKLDRNEMRFENSAG
jgi:hypothetical protein